MSEKLLNGKKGLIMGLRNKQSIAWGIAQDLHNHGAELAFTYVGEPLEKRVVPLGESLGSSIFLDCDVTNDEQLSQTFNTLEEKWGQLDFVIHAIAFSDREELKGKFVNTSRENFKMSMDISAYSLVAVTREASRLMKNGGSIVTLTYYGAEKVMPHYNVMGPAKAALETSVKYLAADLGEDNIRVNAISAGPIKTLAAMGIGDFGYILKWNANNAPLRRNVTIEEVGKTATYLVSDLSTGVTGENIHVDAGYHVIGMKNPNAPDMVYQD